VDDNQTADDLAFEERLRGLARRAQQGDRSVLPELRRALEADPSMWQRYGDLAAAAQQAWLDLLAGNDLLLHESVRRKQEELRAELAGASPSPLEKLLVERVVACWLQTMYSETAYALARGPDATPAVRHELMKRQESSQRRYLASIKQLALVRKLLAPGVSPAELAMRPVREGSPHPPRNGDASLRLAGVN
jgi:hypothetical protein